MVAVGGGFGQPGAGPTHAPPLQYLSLPLNEVDVLELLVETLGPTGVSEAVSYTHLTLPTKA